MLPLDQTCRLQRRSLYAYPADVFTAKARGGPHPCPHLTGFSASVHAEAAMSTGPSGSLWRRGRTIS